jgi:hypothetical protein
VRRFAGAAAGRAIDEDHRVTVRDPDERIWCLIRISDVAAVLDRYELWKDEPWYHAVDWALVQANWTRRWL